MSDKKLKALTNTVIKLSTNDSASLPDSDKFPLIKDTELTIKSVRFADKNHWAVELASPINGFKTWFAFIPHVEIFEVAGFKNTLKKIVEDEWNFFGKGTKGEGENGFWQRIVNKYWKEGVNRNDINTSAEVSSIHNPWSAAFVSWVMREAGATNKFLYSQRHADYIRDSIKKRKTNDTNASFVGYRLNETSVQVGDLVCASRAEDAGRVGYDTTTDYASHCDIVVATRPGEIDVIGGNVSNTVKKNTLDVDDRGNLTDTSRPWFVVIKNLL